MACGNRRVVSVLGLSRDPREGAVEGAGISTGPAARSTRRSQSARTIST